MEWLNHLDTVWWLLQEEETDCSVCREQRQRECQRKDMSVSENVRTTEVGPDG